MPRHQFTAGRAQKKNQRCQPRRPRRERIPIRPHTSLSLSSRRGSIRRNLTTRRKHAGCPTRRTATSSARSKPPRVKSSASAYLAARCVIIATLHKCISMTRYSDSHYFEKSSDCSENS